MSPALYLFGVVWLIPSLLAYALTFGYFQNKFRLIAHEYYWSDLVFAILIGVTGPVGFGISLIMSNFGSYGLKWK